MGRLRGNPWAVLAILCSGFFMTLVDLTIVNIAIPNMVDKLDASLDEILWVVNAYTLALAVLIITAGRLGDIRGKKVLFVSGVALFTFASLACGLSQNPAQLIAARGVQGIGAAFLLPQTLSIIVDIFPPKRRGVALGVWGIVAGVSGATGPIVGGLLVTHLDWRWIFFVNVPIGVLVLAAAIPIMPSTHRVVRHRFDVTGVTIATVSLFLLTFALIDGQRYEWNRWIWTMIGAAAALFAVFLGQQRRQQDGEPLVPFSLFRDRNFTVMNFVGVTLAFGIVGLLLPLTIYLQSVLGYSALKAGLVLLPLAVGAMIMAGPAGVIAERFGGKYILICGLLAFTGGLFWVMSMAGDSRSWTAFLAPLFVIGLGAGCTFVPMSSEVMRNVPPKLTGAASGVNNALRQVGSVLAGAIVGAVLQGQLASTLADQARQRSGELPAAFRDQFVRGFGDAGKHIEVGAQSGGGLKLPPGLPAGAAQRIQEVAAQVFGHGFIDALKPTMLVCAAVLFAAVIVTFFAENPRGPSANPHGLPVSAEEIEAATVPAESLT